MIYCIVVARGGFTYDKGTIFYTDVSELQILWQPLIYLAPRQRTTCTSVDHPVCLYVHTFVWDANHAAVWGFKSNMGFRSHSYNSCWFDRVQPPPVQFAFKLIWLASRLRDVTLLQSMMDALLRSYTLNRWKLQPLAVLWHGRLLLPESDHFMKMPATYFRASGIPLHQTLSVDNPGPSSHARFKTKTARINQTRVTLLQTAETFAKDAERQASPHLASHRQDNGTVKTMLSWCFVHAFTLTSDFAAVSLCFCFSSAVSPHGAPKWQSLSVTTKTGSLPLARMKDKIVSL